MTAELENGRHLSSLGREIRILGLDDAPFSFQDKSVPLVGVVWRVPNYIEGVLRTDVSVDGCDAVDKIVRLVSRSRFCEQIRLILLDGASFGGFNVVDLEALHKRLGIPAATVTRKKPDLDAIRDALRGHFNDWETRFKIITRGELFPVDVGGHTIYVKVQGMERKELEALLNLSIVRGATPEPLRIARLLASAFVDDEPSGPL